MRPKIVSPRTFLCNDQPHQLRTKFRLSKCNFLTRPGLHEIYIMSRKLILQDFLNVCNVFQGRGRQTRGFPSFFGKVLIVSRTLARMFLVGGSTRPRKRKRTKRENPRKSRENPEKLGESQKDEGRTSPDLETPPFENPRLAALDSKVLFVLGSPPGFVISRVSPCCLLSISLLSHVVFPILSLLSADLHLQEDQKGLSSLLQCVLQRQTATRKGIGAYDQPVAISSPEANCSQNDKRWGGGYAYWWKAFQCEQPESTLSRPSSNTSYLLMLLGSGWWRRALEGDRAAWQEWYWGWCGRIGFEGR